MTGTTSKDGLTLVLPTGWLRFDAIAASNWLNEDDLRFLRPLTDEPIFPLGETSCAIFLGTASGRVIGRDNDWILMYRAENLEEFLQAVLIGTRGLIQTRWLTEGQVPEGRG